MTFGCPKKLHTQVDYLNNNPEVAMVYSRSLWMGEDGRLINKKSRYRDIPSGDVFNKLYLRDFIGPCTGVVIKKSALNTIGLFDGSLIIAADYDLWLRIAKEFKVSGIDKPLCKWRNTPRSLSKNEELLFKEGKRIIEKHHKLSKDSSHPISLALYKKALARLFFRAGKYHSKRGDRKKALENFFLSLKYNPFNLRTLRYYFVTYIKQLMAML